MGPDKDIWTQSLSNELGRLLTSSNAGVPSTDSIEFLAHSVVPSDKKVTYTHFVCDYQPLKQESHRVRITVGGHRLPCDQDAGAPAANLLGIKILLNSITSDVQKELDSCLQT